MTAREHATGLVNASKSVPRIAGINRTADRRDWSDWSEIRTSLGMREVPEKDMPRMLYDCITDLFNSQERTKSILKEIDSFQAKIKQHAERSGSDA